MTDSVSVLLTCHARPKLISEQLCAIKAQTVQPVDLVVWHNACASHPKPKSHVLYGQHVISGNRSDGVWTRFAYCLHGFSSKYVCVFDDDTIPGPKWLESCIANMRLREGLYGSNGVTFVDGDREKRVYAGWKNRCPSPVQVDIVGHAWFFPRDWLRAYLGLERASAFDTCGEDYHWAWTCQNLGIPVMVPPQWCDDLTGSMKGDEYGDDGVALYKRPAEAEKKLVVHNLYLEKGWKPLALR